MISSFFKAIFGSRNERLLKKYRKQVKAINALEAQYQSLSDADLAEQTGRFRARLLSEPDCSLLTLLPDAFAVCREAARRVLGMRHFDVQLIGGIALHEGRIAEMRTGEGKTLVATLPVYLNALAGRGVHVITVNDYLASRDAAWMGRIFRFLGLTVGVNLANMTPADKKAAYACDITYGTNNEFGFDYLRDNMVYTAEEKVQRPLFFAVVDEVDSILIDEARTPLIISGQAEDDVALYQQMQSLIIPLVRQEGEEEDIAVSGDFIVDEKSQQILLTEAGHERAEALLIEAGLLSPDASLYDAENISLLHHVYAALRAQHLFFKDQHYVVRQQEVVIVDEFTGRLMAGRRWSEGLHQAVEAKEHVPIQKENKTLAAITFQNYFRLYQKLSGMTGTADTEAAEFYEIYHLETVVIPTHLPVRRLDFMDQVYINTEQKYKAILQDIQRCHTAGQPVLVGTTSIENSEILSRLLNQAGLPHQVLNAKQHAKEADIIQQAGYPGVITIATNMAGRGTDIVLGGNIEKEREAIHVQDVDEAQKKEAIAALESAWQDRHQAVLDAGGLHVIGTERHESRRIDNQLRGRSGRQGDPGSSRFYLSLEDSLMRIFAGDRVKAIMARLKLPDDEPIEHPLVTRSLETAQRKVESRHFDVRKQLLQYDDVANEQRKIIYEQRDVFLTEAEPRHVIDTILMAVVEEVFLAFVPKDTVDQQWDIAGLMAVCEQDFEMSLPIDHWMADASLDANQLLLRVQEAAKMHWERKVAALSDWPEATQVAQMVCRSLLLQALDAEWRDHLSHLDYLRQGIHLRGYAAKNPQQEYKREAFLLFQRMLERMKSRIATSAMQLDIAPPQPVTMPDAHPALAVHEVAKTGRNDLCPCGSGKKYKYCHGRIS